MESRTLTKTRKLVESSLLVAIGFILSYIVLWEMPSGGSVTLLSMLPILLVGLRHGPAWGVGAGVAYALLQFIQKPWFVHPAQFLLDYILAFGCLGLSGFFRGWRRFGFQAAAASLIALRFVFSTVAGVIFWSDATKLWAAITYSLGYNASYLVPELLLTLIVGSALVQIPRLKLLDPQPRA